MRLAYMSTFLLVMVWIPAQVSAQALNCAALLEAALTRAAEACLMLDPETACYGAGTLAGQGDSTADFSSVGDQVSLIDLPAITGAATDTDTYSIAQLQLTDEIRSTLTLLGAGKLAWDERVSRPYQGFFYTPTDTQPTRCAETPDILLIATADDQPIDFLLNDSEVVIAGQVALNWQNPNNLTATVLTGTITVLDGAVAAAGETLSAVALDDGTILFWSAPRPADADENSFIQAANALAVALGDDPAPVVAGAEALAEERCVDDSTHTVSNGETLFIIGQRYGVSVDQLVAANRIADRDYILVGQVLALPCGAAPATVAAVATPHAPSQTGCTPTTHIVGRGDNVFRLAQSYNSSIDAITRANNLPSPQQIIVGQALVIPCI